MYPDQFISRHVNPIFQDQSSLRSPIHRDQSNLKSPIYHHQSSLKNPVYQDQSSQRNPVYQDQSSLRNPVYQDQYGHRNPVYQEQSSPRNPLYQDQSSPRNPIYQDQSRFSGENRNQSPPTYRNDHSSSSHWNPIYQDQSISIHGNPVMTSTPYPNTARVKPEAVRVKLEEEPDYAASLTHVNLWLDRHVKPAQPDLFRNQYARQENPSPRNQLRNSTDQFR